MPCAYALATARLPGKRWRTRAERLALLEGVRRRIAEESRLSLKELAGEAGFSPYHLQRLFTVAFGESPKAMGDRLRAERAAQMLRAGATPLQVVMSLRYSEPSALSRNVRRHFGTTPSDFRKNRQPDASALGQD